MKIFLLTFSIVISIAISQAQKKDTVFNYLGIEIKEPESEFLLFNKKEKAKVKSADFLTQDKIIRLAPELEGYLIEEIDYTIKKEDSVQLETKNIGPVFTEKSLQELSKLEKGNILILQLYLRNRSTQLKRITRKHLFFINE